MSYIEVYVVLGVLGTGILIMLAMGSVFMLVQNWHKNATNKRLTKLEEGQARFEIELKDIKEGQAKLEEGQARFEIELKDIKEGQDKLEEGQAKLNDYVESELHRMHGLLEKIMDTIGELAKQHSKK